MNRRTPQQINMKKAIDRKFREARIWSNKELRKITPSLCGDVCNVSGWRDKDKEGSTYEKYFENISSYSITNYKKENACGYQGDIENEILLDLTEDLNSKLINKFDIVFNHTTLEHIFELEMAFKNLCLLTKDIVILVVPFMQEEHTDYGDYWRFTPQAIDLLFKKNNLKTIYINYNDTNKNSIYIFAVASKKPKEHEKICNIKNNKLKEIYTTNIGTKIIKNSFFDNLYNLFVRLFITLFKI